MAEKQTLQTVRYPHEGIIDEIVMNPAISQGELAKRFGYTQTWMSIVVNSDAFQERLRERKAELTDPKIVASINERLDAIAGKALEKIIDRLDNPAANISHKDLVAIAKLGVGDKNTRVAAPAIQQSLYVVNIPPPAQNSAQWLSDRTPRGVSEIIENVTRG